MKYAAIKPIALCAAIVIGSVAHAASYTYVENYSYVGKTRLTSAQQDAELQSDLTACDGMIGAQAAAPLAAYRSCMLQRGWKYRSLTRKKAPDDPYFSSNVKVAPGHFIDHDNGMDCYNTGGAEICDPPKGTVHYFDPDQNLPCTRTGISAVCSNL